MSIKTSWEYSERTESLRLIHAAHQIMVGFYRVNNFIVLPYNPLFIGINTVTFPDLNYRNIKGFWDKVKSVDVTDLPIKIEEGVITDTINLLKSANLESPDFSQIQKVWSKAQDDIISKIYEIIPSKKNIIKKLTIYPTSFGTSCSFNWEADGNVILYLRNDQTISAIAEAIITSITRRDIYDKLEGMWQESEMITDWILTQSSLSQVIKKYDQTPFSPTIKGVRIKQQAKLLAASDEFYKKLGFPVSQKVFGLNGLTPEIHKKPLENLTPTERQILKLLIEKANSVVTFDDFGNEIFKSEEDYSLYAIAKNIERLRSKLEANGVSGSYIQTLRGKGYVLKN